jgi:hypothetical protein
MLVTSSIMQGLHFSIYPHGRQGAEVKVKRVTDDDGTATVFTILYLKDSGYEVTNGLKTTVDSLRVAFASEDLAAAFQGEIEAVKAAPGPDPNDAESMKRKISIAFVDMWPTSTDHVSPNARRMDEAFEGDAQTRSPCFGRSSQPTGENHIQTVAEALDRNEEVYGTKGYSERIRASQDGAQKRSIEAQSEELTIGSKQPLPDKRIRDGMEGTPGRHPPHLPSIPNNPITSTESAKPSKQSRNNTRPPSVPALQPVSSSSQRKLRSNNKTKVSPPPPPPKPLRSQSKPPAGVAMSQSPNSEEMSPNTIPQEDSQGSQAVLKARDIKTTRNKRAREANTDWEQGIRDISTLDHPADAGIGGGKRKRTSASQKGSAKTSTTDARKASQNPLPRHTQFKKPALPPNKKPDQKKPPTDFKRTANASKTRSRRATKQQQGNADDDGSDSEGIAAVDAFEAAAAAHSASEVLSQPGNDLGNPVELSDNEEFSVEATVIQDRSPQATTVAIQAGVPDAAGSVEDGAEDSYPTTTEQTRQRVAAKSQIGHAAAALRQAKHAPLSHSTIKTADKRTKPSSPFGDKRQFVANVNETQCTSKTLALSPAAGRNTQAASRAPTREPLAELPQNTPARSGKSARRSQKGARTELSPIDAKSQDGMGDPASIVKTNVSTTVEVPHDAAVPEHPRRSCAEIGHEMEPAAMESARASTCDDRLEQSRHQQLAVAAKAGSDHGRANLTATANNATSASREQEVEPSSHLQLPSDGSQMLLLMDETRSKEPERKDVGTSTSTISTPVTKSMLADAPWDRQQPSQALYGSRGHSATRASTAKSSMIAFSKHGPLNQGVHAESPPDDTTNQHKSKGSRDGREPYLHDISNAYDESPAAYMEEVSIGDHEGGDTGLYVPHSNDPNTREPPVTLDRPLPIVARRPPSHEVNESVHIVDDIEGRDTGDDLEQRAPLKNAAVICEQHSQGIADSKVASDMSQGGFEQEEAKEDSMPGRTTIQPHEPDMHTDHGPPAKPPVKDLPLTQNLRPPASAMEVGQQHPLIKSNTNDRPRTNAAKAESCSVQTQSLDKTTSRVRRGLGHSSPQHHECSSREVTLPDTLNLNRIKAIAADFTKLEQSNQAGAKSRMIQYKESSPATSGDEAESSAIISDGELSDSQQEQQLAIDERNAILYTRSKSACRTLATQTFKNQTTDQNCRDQIKYQATRREHLSRRPTIPAPIADDYNDRTLVKDESVGLDPQRRTPKEQGVRFERRLTPLSDSSSSVGHGDRPSGTEGRRTTLTSDIPPHYNSLLQAALVLTRVCGSDI